MVGSLPSLCGRILTRLGQNVVSFGPQGQSRATLLALWPALLTGLLWSQGCLAAECDRDQQMLVPTCA
jgi:hypothetical protein